MWYAKSSMCGSFISRVLVGLSNVKVSIAKSAMISVSWKLGMEPYMVHQIKLIPSCIHCHMPPLSFIVGLSLFKVKVYCFNFWKKVMKAMTYKSNDGPFQMYFPSEVNTFLYFQNKFQKLTFKIDIIQIYTNSQKTHLKTMFFSC